MDSALPLLAGDLPRIQVALVPDGSVYAREVRAAAQACGAVFVRADATIPGDRTVRVYVVDLTRALATARLGPKVLAISRQQDLDAYDVVDPAHVAVRLPRALRNLVEQETLRARVEAERGTVEVLNEIGYALSALTDRHTLLDELLTHARRLLYADGGTVYLVEDGVLHFAAAQNDTMPFFPTRRTLPIDDRSIAGFVAMRGVPLNIEDMHNLDPSAPYRPNLTFDAQTGYHTKSALVVPLKDRDARVIGALALFNRKPVPGVPLASFERVMTFSDRHVALARSIAGQAAVALENYRLYGDIQQLFSGFVEAAVTAIEARDPTTGGHSHRVAELTTLLAREVNEDTTSFSGDRFTSQELTELHYASMLHDFGKVGVREEVLLKAEKLFPWEIAEVEMRFRLAALQAVLESVREELAEHHINERLGVLQADLALVRQLNRPNTPFGAVERAAVMEVAKRWRVPTDDQGHEHVLRPREVDRLCIPRGSLDPEERLEIERHVEHTYRFLKVIPWTRELKNVPNLAYAHHEKLDGTGYPRRLPGSEIPLGAKLMAIADIFDALTASDRPYRQGMPADRAVNVLREEAAAGKILAPAVELMAARKLWRKMRSTR